MVPMGSPGRGRRGVDVSACAVALDDIENGRVEGERLAGVEGERLAGVEGEVSARLWNIDVKVVLSELFVECLACSALYRSRGLSMRVRVGVFGLVERRGE
jgi:hypothetical protein